MDSNGTIIPVSRDLSTTKKELGPVIQEAGTREQHIATIVNNLGNTCHNAINKLNDEQIERLMQREGESAYSIAALIRKLAQERSGHLFFSIDEWAKLGTMFPDNVRKSFTMLPRWSQEVLDSPCPFQKNKTIRETHVQFIDAPDLSIVRLFKEFPEMFYEDGWHFWKEAFATTIHAEGNLETIKSHLVVLDGIPETEFMDYDDQGMILKRYPEYRRSTAYEEAMKNFAVYRLTGRYPHGHAVMNTSTFDSRGYVVRVGGGNFGGINFEPGGLGVCGAKMIAGAARVEEIPLPAFLWA